jgi:[protein-PII] uridylyltransferase
MKRGSIAGELHEVGLLLALIPEFAPVTGKVHHDVYHVYTVDVHSVAAVDALRALCRGENAHERPLASRLAAEIARPEPLFLATLLHDVGKGYPDANGSRKNHSITGADLCDTILPRLGVSSDDADEVKALVRDHLVMSHIATRRDLDDPSTTADFCGQVRGREALRNLYLLTVCDLTTTSPTAMTSWKARMLDELYFASDATLGGNGDNLDVARMQSVKDVARALWQGKPADLDAFVASMPDRYLLANAPDAICAHARAAESRQREKRAVIAAVVPSRHPEVSELCVVADDKPGPSRASRRRSPRAVSRSSARRSTPASRAPARARPSTSSGCATRAAAPTASRRRSRVSRVTSRACAPGRATRTSSCASG